MIDFEFEWDDKKATANLNAHRISFKEAATVFDDPLATTEENCIKDGEVRWQIIGKTETATESESSAHGKQTTANGGNMTIVRYKRNEIPPPTDEDLARLRALAEMPDSEIDYSDIPELDDIDFKYSVGMTFDELLAMPPKQRNELARKIDAAKRADRAALKAEQEAERAIAEARQLVHQT